MQQHEGTPPFAKCGVAAQKDVRPKTTAGNVVGGRGCSLDALTPGHRTTTNERLGTGGGAEKLVMLRKGKKGKKKSRKRRKSLFVPCLLLRVCNTRSRVPRTTEKTVRRRAV